MAGCFLVRATVKFVHALQVPGLGAQGAYLARGVEGSTVVRVLSVLHGRAEIGRTDLGPGLQSRFNIREAVEEPDQCWTFFDAEREEGAGKAGTVAKECDPSVGRGGLLAEVRDEPSVERGRVHVAHVGGDEERGLSLCLKYRFGVRHEGFLDVAVEVGLGEVVNRG